MALGESLGGQGVRQGQEERIEAAVVIELHVRHVRSPASPVRQRQGEAGPLPRPGLGNHGAAVALCDVLADRQSQAQAVGLGRHRIVVKVAVEQERDLVLLDTAAGVGHGQADPSVDEFQLHGHRASGGGKLQGIGEQLVEQQLDGGLVKSAGVAVRSAPEFQLDLFERKQTLSPGTDRTDRLRQIPVPDGEGRVLPQLSRRHQKDRVLSIWSAGCSSGEEPYTLSIYLKEFFGPQASQWDTRILATDISQQALSKAKAGQYKLPADMPGEWLKRYFVKDDTTCLYTAAPQLKQNVIFRTFNLMDPIHFRLKFDVIFCRNVMIYFDQATRDALVRRFYDALHPTGYLFISHSESLGQTRLFRTAAPAVYQKLPLGTHQ